MSLNNLCRQFIFMTGFSGGVMVNVYAYAREITPRALDGAVTGFINTFSVGSGALFQPLIGVLLDAQAVPGSDGRPHYALDDYTLALGALVAGGLLAIMCSLFLRETQCRHVAGDVPGAEH